jgi:hypothetical protein
MIGNRSGALSMHRKTQRQTSRGTPRLMPRLSRTITTLMLSLVVSVVAGACSTGDSGADLALDCRTVDTPFTRYVSEDSRPPWATDWHSGSMSAAVDLSAPQQPTSDRDLVDLAATCTGATMQTWNELTPVEENLHIDVVVGVQHYFYRAGTVDGDDGRYILAVVVQRTGQSSARVAVQAMPVVGQLPTTAPDGAVVVQSLRSDGLL